MALEIERKYLVSDTSYREMAEKQVHIVQGYLCREPDRTVRIRLKDDTGFITIKGKTEGIVRTEFEYSIPAEDARRLLEMCTPPLLKKTRYMIPYEGKLWEVDEFSSPRTMRVAEIELEASDESFALPPFIGEEVTGDPAYYNSNIK